MNTLPRPSPRRCFTLLEVLISITLALVLLATVFGFLFNMLSARQRAIKFAARQRAASIVIERIERDIIFTLVGDSRVGAGIKGDASSLLLKSRSVGVNLADQAGREREVFGDLQAIQYRFDDSQKRLQVGRVSRNPSSGASTSAMEYIGADIFRVRFRYHDGEAWLETYDSLQASQLPVAIEIAFWFEPWPGEEIDRDSGDLLNELQRDTFDARAGFDEEARARINDLELNDEPVPDRRRVLMIPDARGRGES